MTGVDIDAAAAAVEQVIKKYPKRPIGMPGASFAWGATSHEIAEAVVVEALGDEQLFGWCPDCDGVGAIASMVATPNLYETEHACERCEEFGGLVQVWPR